MRESNLISIFQSLIDSRITPYGPGFSVPDIEFHGGLLGIGVLFGSGAEESSSTVVKIVWSVVILGLQAAVAVFGNDTVRRVSLPAYVGSDDHLRSAELLSVRDGPIVFCVEGKI